MSVHAGNKSNSIESIKSHLLVKQQQKQDLLANHIDILEISKKEDEASYLDIVFPNIGFRLPIILGSDNHEIDKYNITTNCWIKADPTFEGLKQIIYEPDERVCIQEIRPEGKAGYHVIDSVTLNGGHFGNNHIILFNPNLNTIIGGRSTGKSTLLKCIASKIDGNIHGDDLFIQEQNRNVSIKWQDQNTPATTIRDIEYFPQSYMHDIARNEKKLNDLIVNIIKSKDEGSLLSRHRAFCDNNKSDIISKTNTLFKIQNQLKELNSTVKEKGDSTSIQQEIQTLEKKLAEIKSTTSLSEQELKDFEKKRSEISKNKESIKTIDKDVETLKTLSTRDIINNSVKYDFGALSETLLNHISSLFDTVKVEANQKWTNEINLTIKQLENKREEIVHSITSIEDADLYKKGLEAISNNIVYKELNERVDVERNKLKDILDIEARQKQTTEQRETLEKEIIEHHKSYVGETQKLIAKLSISHQGLEIRANQLYQREKLRTFLESRLNQRGADRQEYVNKIVDGYEKDHEKVIRSFIGKNLNNQIDYKGGYLSENVTSELLSTNWIDITYNLIYQNDEFRNMSQGKQAFVILKLLLEFSDKKSPILIDQPEDSLDNRAIYSELVQYLKTKKKERQIILVTHNSNVVVSADAEQVIVANQHGNDSKNENNIRFHYYSGSLEHTFPKNASESYILKSQGTREHVCEILEGGKQAFEKREEKYGFK